MKLERQLREREGQLSQGASPHAGLENSQQEMAGHFRPRLKQSYFVENIVCNVYNSSRALLFPSFFWSLSWTILALSSPYHF